MKNYTVYFEMYGKKMKVKVLAESIVDAKNKVSEKIIFHKVVKDDKDEFNQIMDVMDSFMDCLNKK